jgi:hypothetical protein
MHKIILQYIDGWKESNITKILSSLSDNCIIIESHGPMYEGRDKVKKWAEQWLLNGKVIKWDVKSEYVVDNTIIFEWVFQYSSKGKAEIIDGITVAKFKKNKINYLREYKTTKPVFDFK